MSKALYICMREKIPDVTSIDILLAVLSKRLVPDNIEPFTPIRMIRKREALLVINPNENTRIKDVSLCQGCIIDSYDDWQNLDSKIPEGTFSIIRSGDEYTEILTDPVSSYSIWYYFDNELFIASSSQRAIIHYLKTFEFNDNVIPWMLSSGILGPGYSWDRRLKLIPGHTSLFLNKENWSLKETRHDFVFTPVKNKDADSFIKKSLYTLFDKIELNFDKWILPLSGGGDSRLLLTMLHEKKGIRTITWGTGEALHDHESDAYIAQKVAAFYQVPNQYFPLDESGLPPSVILRRILVAGEGRTDNIGAYADGFQLWKHLFENGIHGIIRGDHGFGTRSPVLQTQESFRWKAFKLLSDYKEYEEIRKFTLPDQKFPASFNRKSRESLIDWEIRLRQTFRFPFLMSALNELKISYTDVFNPLLSKSIIEAVLCCPEYANKKFFKRFNREIGPGFDFATRAAIPSIMQILEKEGFSAYIRTYLIEHENTSIIDPCLIQYVLRHMNQSKDPASRKIFRKWIKSKFNYYIPYALKNAWLLKYRNEPMNFTLMAFRIFLILSMAEMLKRDTSCANGG